jgi:hypothetical protein
VIVAIALIAIFILFDLVLYKRFLSTSFKGKTSIKSHADFIDGKKVINFSYPKGMEGGIFSKTYIQIDDKSILRLRTLMIPPDELWGEKKKK